MTTSLDAPRPTAAPARVYLEQEDDAATIRARIEAGCGKQTSVEVFVPYGQRTLRTSVGMLLLRRFVEDAVIAVYLITDDHHVQRRAREQAIPAAGRTQQGQSFLSALRHESEHSPVGYARYTRERRVHVASRWRWFRRTGALLSAAVVPPLAAAWVLVPSATITLTVPLEQVDQSLNVRVSSLASTVDLQDATVPGKVVEVPVDFRVTGHTTGAVPDPRSMASGAVRFISRSEQPVRVPGGTRVATDSNLVFTTQSEVMAHPGLPQGVTVAVAATEAGTRGNVKAKDIIRIEDAQLATALRVENEAALTGGVDGLEKAVTEADYQRLRAEAINQARDHALEDIERRLPADSAIAPGSLRLRITTEELAPRIGTPASWITLTITGLARALTFRNDDLRTIVRRRIALANDEEGAASAQLSVSLGKGISADNDLAIFESHVEGTIGRWLDEGVVRRTTAGKSPAEARRALTQLAPDTAPSIRLSTFWADRVSPFHWRINVVQVPS